MLSGLSAACKNGHLIGGFRVRVGGFRVRVGGFRVGGFRVGGFRVGGFRVRVGGFRVRVGVGFFCSLCCRKRRRAALQ